jgi:hypothetical protein
MFPALVKIPRYRHGFDDEHPGADTRVSSAPGRPPLLQHDVDRLLR